MFESLFEIGKNNSGIVVRWKKENFVGLYRWNVDGMFDLIVVRRATHAATEHHILGDTVTISIRSAPEPAADSGTGALYGFKAVVKPTFDISDFPNDIKFQNILTRISYLYSCSDAASDAAIVRFIDEYVDETNLQSISWDEVVNMAAKDYKNADFDHSLKVRCVDVSHICLLAHNQSILSVASQLP